ncbi:amino acid/amide ABC transporter ATP-binding protein 2 (HAAT family) [Prosthecobacter fusiformis]|uniref:Amino acid/amide ABC transporter ATP-binding protein 2 (HAAT family) n=1 Tax=Prosthecobacter fusiformis TaxID=48464 RepID=A0A4R7RQF4_9BACT|nr:urea ABC transporter ATP-binding subunit UrtE [Prosthecobacter fusiformis]TDU67329.1 amino acid/amide ABC transporter ATP-binding protein 2 (HAAT family) [Prosthecobacter fusiformis]
MLTLSSIQASIGGSRILRGVDLTVPDGQLCCLMGRNGVGKTSTLRTIVGLFKPDAGKVMLAGTDITRMAPEERARLGLAYVPQGRDIFPFLTVEENLMLGATARGLKNKEKLDRIFTLFPIIKEFLPRKGGMLSGGQQQQLAIARALLTEPKVLILDEPTEGIQPNVIDQIGDALKILRSEDKMSILLVEQYLDFCRELADVFYIMDRGTVVAEGGVKDLTDEVVKKHLTV